MNDKDLLQQVKDKAREWINGEFDSDTKNKVKHLLENNEKELIDSFYKTLEFGTGGMRGIMGVGTNRVNIYTIGMATQGLSNYLKKEFKDLSEIRVVIAHDSRNNSRSFAENSAQIFAANGFKVYLFEDLRPTPELSFAIRHLKCQSGIVITASHNPKEYNGYKVYWEDGGQIINPHDKNIIEEVNKIKSIDEVKFKGKSENIEIIGEGIDHLYVEQLKSLSLSPQIIQQQRDLKIIYTPIHGTGVKLVPMALKAFGFENIYNIPEQDISDGNFPTVKSPNPEETEALNMALEKAQKTGADLVMGTDPDADRVGIAVKNDKGEYTILNGNQTAAILIYYLITKWAEKNKLKGKEYIVKTIVTTELLTEIAEKYGVEHYDVLTGFKYIANIIRHNEGKKVFIGGAEESYGYLAGEFVRDKDAVMSCALIAEATAWAKNQGKTLYDLLLEIYIEYSLYKEKLISIVKKGKEGSEEIQAIMDRFRNNPPAELNHVKIIQIHDYLIGKTFDLSENSEKETELPISNVLQYILEDGSKISVRPSGTEPKIKLYFSVRDKMHSKGEYEELNAKLERRIDNLISGLGIN
ncbi:phospho-sugar mutase [Bacteroidota bacterium]